MPCITNIRRLLFMLGGTPNYIGFQYVVYGLWLLSENSETKLSACYKMVISGYSGSFSYRMENGGA